MDLQPFLDSGNYKGLVTFSDIHAHAQKLKKGIRYAIKNDLFVVFLGDLVDGHDQPLETVSVVKKLLDEDRAVLVIGNHDDKFRRFAIGNPVQLKKAQKQTLEDVPEKYRDDFLQLMVDVTTHRNAAFTHRIHDVTFVHGSAHRTLWDDRDNISKKAMHRALYGEVNGERDEDDFPVRLYNWVDEVPNGHHVVVGHDRKPMGNKLKKTGPYTHQGEQGGRATFTDMGCGKGGDLCLAVFEIGEGGKMDMTKHEAI